MKIPKIDHIIEICNHHLTTIKTINPEIETYFTIYLLILSSAAFDQEISKIVLTRVQLARDPSLLSFVEAYLNDHITNPNTKVIKERILKKFGPFYIEKFKEESSKNPIIENSYNSIITNRNEVAHGGDLKITFTEFVNYYEKAHTILDVLGIVLLGKK
ncbi:MAG: hypothetical protein HQ591_00845 [candidate division Zixibacteria bacterium]|nr:hypothetical protein [Candidatus Tariuqbacter arcticus]